MTEKFPHRPVLLERVIESLLMNREGVYLDGTLGAGGHAEALLGKLQGKGTLIGMDRDLEILGLATKRLETFANFKPVHGSYNDLNLAKKTAGSNLDGILLDLGVSSLQLDSASRGFSFMHDGPLDMRMDPSQGDSAADLINDLEEEELAKIIFELGEERFSRRIARAIVMSRRTRRIETTRDLATLVGRAIPRAVWPRNIHPATRTFQALRIAVNGEIEKLENFLENVSSFMNPKGRLVILSYHSLEDRPVKHFGLNGTKKGIWRIITKKPIQAEEAEMSENPRARSAKMRVFERMEEEAA